MDFDTKIVGKIAITNHGKTGFYFLTLLTSSIVTTLVALQRIDKNRHADRDGVQLSEKDRARAKALVEALDGTSIDAIYSTSIRGNLYIAAPLTTARGMEIKRTNAFDPANAFLDVVAASAGQTIVWDGNMDNLSPIWKSHALDGPPPLAHGDPLYRGVGSIGHAQSNPPPILGPTDICSAPISFSFFLSSEGFGQNWLKLVLVH